MKTSIKTVLLDLDGTILDTNELIIQSFLHALKEVAPTEFAREQLIQSMGLPLQVQLQRFSGLEDVSHLEAAYRVRNRELHDELVCLFPNVLEVIESLHQAGIQIGVVTTKVRMSTERSLKFLQVPDVFGAVITVEDVVHPKPHPEPVLKALERLGGDPGSTLMVGDSPVDMMSAVSAGVIPVGVAWSLKEEALLWEAGARFMLNDMRDLYEIIGLEREPLAKS
ncbi:HAD-IA family hydrolase [Paenibacillus sp. GCM10012307]|uniref:HAD-IA family hydrolase n=1 Tax=Paenibacillus roseus TaxID=2798579 RepID=A0A934MPE2_9BACL|nr:HAD-IA family hydrolase [Paenibacillus roseus]MBJ6360788.1 HAD-IA family hydrolase [Paenibacillus roseus]